MISRLKGNNKQISPTAKYKPVTPFVTVENWMRFPHRRLSTALQQSNFHCNLRARFPQDGPGSISFTCRSNIQLIFNCPFYYLSVKKRRNPILGIGPHRQATVNINVSCLALALCFSAICPSQPGEPQVVADRAKVARAECWEKAVHSCC